ncbi:MAG: hypothetical protein IPQ20_11430 [Thermomonas sp.]|nr:hypothetical protein [Thermomonas sp.]
MVKRRWLVLGILAGVVALALLKTLMTTPIYPRPASCSWRSRAPGGAGGWCSLSDFDGWDPGVPADPVQADPEPVAGGAGRQ